MKPNENKNLTLLADPFWQSYIFAVTTSSLVLVLKALVSQLAEGSFERATNNPFEVKIVHFVSIYVLVLVFVWIGTFTTVWIFVLLARATSRQFGQQGVAYTLVCGAIAGAALCVLAIWIPNLGINDQRSELTFWSRYIVTVPSFGIAGLLGGWAYWRAQPHGA